MVGFCRKWRCCANLRVLVRVVPPIYVNVWSLEDEKREGSLYPLTKDIKLGFKPNLCI